MPLYFFFDDRNKKLAEQEIRKLAISMSNDLMSETGIIVSFAVRRVMKTCATLADIVEADKRGEVYNPNL